jgi:hypothetical protein
MSYHINIIIYDGNINIIIIQQQATQMTWHAQFNLMRLFFNIYCF